jgi:hypothetical protein
MIQGGDTMLSHKNTLHQGNVGLGIAISWFTMKGCIVSIPLNDIQEYDLVVDFGDCKPKLIQVKTTITKERSKYKVQLKTNGKSFKYNRSDYLFVVDGDGTKYLIPREEIKSSSAIALGDNYSQYICP